MTTFVRNLLYRQVKDHILGELAAGHWKAGEMLPSEKLFAEQLGVSQGTVRKAIQELVEENVLYREQGRGTFVQSYLASGYCNSFHRFTNEATGTIVPFTMRLVRFERVPAMKADRPARVLGLPSDGELFHALRVYSWEGKDVGISELWLYTKRFAKLTAEKLARHEGSLYQFYERDLGVTIVSVDDRWRAKVFTPALASLGQFMTGARPTSSSPASERPSAGCPWNTGSLTARRKTSTCRCRRLG